MHIT